MAVIKEETVFAVVYGIVLGALCYASAQTHSVGFLEEKNWLPASNCFIVSESGTYCFATVRGNGTQSVGQVSSVEVLWETFGTNVKPNVGDLIKAVSFKDGFITFSTADTFREGNALIAVKDKKGNIIWSWHIWMTDQPEEQVYYNNAGIMMDRNLGATSATPGDVGALGLLYQWGRKDPFLNSSYISSEHRAQATISFPEPEESNKKTGSITYAVTHPTTFIYNGDGHTDWQRANDNTRWQYYKTIYDPCPAGWKVPSSGVWSKAVGYSSSISSEYDRTNEGINFSSDFGPNPIIWYPTTGVLSFGGGSLYGVGGACGYWSVSSDGQYPQYASIMGFDDQGHFTSSFGYYRAAGQAVRCIKE